MPKPNDRPLFAYGSLKPGELAHRAIAHLVERAVPATLEGYSLWVRDGLPLIAPATGRVDGQLLWPEPGTEDEFYRLVRDHEGNNLYSETDVVVDAPSSRITARVFVGRRTSQGNPEAVVHGEWFLRTDPLLTHGLNTASRSARSLLESPETDAAWRSPIESAEFWDAFVPLEGLYLVVCTALERYTALAFGHTLDPGDRIGLLDMDEDARAAVKAARPPKLEARDSRTARSPRSTDSDRPFNAWYQVRSNMVHRGKGGKHDAGLVTSALVGLHDSLRHLVAKQMEFDEAEEFTEADRFLRDLARGR